VATPARTSKSPKKTHQEKDGSTNWKGLEPEVPPFKTETLRESFNKKVCKTNQKKHVTHSNISNFPPASTNLHEKTIEGTFWAGT